MILNIACNVITAYVRYARASAVRISIGVQDGIFAWQ